MLVYAGRAQPDKDLYALLRVALKARLLFPDLQVVVASHVVDDAYLAAAREQLAGEDWLRLVDPTREQLADLYSLADVLVTASTSHFETFGRAPAEALACGAPAIAPRYDGFVETLAQPGGTLVDVELDAQSGTPRVDEEGLLRAVYDVLSSPRLAPRAEVAAIARSRFGRSRTIRLLGYLANGNGSNPAPIAPAELAGLPREWRQPLAELERRENLDALRWFCDECDHERFATHDSEHAAQVRRSLCVPAPVREGA
jgi:glycosyltransferase involved in cell wall biosynthesis